jgi:hypothetical protein
VFITSIRAVSCAVGTIALTGLLTSGAAHALTVPAGDTLQINFDLAGPASVPYFPGVNGLAVDTLGFFESDTGTFTTGVAQLFNGSSLLGTVDFTTGYLQSFSFAAPGSQFTVSPIGSVPDADWSAFANGTIDGILDITFNQTIDVTISVNALGVGVGGNGILDANQQPNITNVSVLAPTPLPATLPLFATGLGALCLFGWRRRGKALAV